ncbi:MAG: tRNA (guanine(6)-N2)-methyltransferase [Candidatus Bathyarchaeota archaeon]
MNFDFMVTTINGFEDVAAKEVQDILGVEVKLDVGKIFFNSNVNAIYMLNLDGRCIHKVFIVLGVLKFKNLDEIYRETRRIDYGWIIGSNQSFAVRAERHGYHNFTSLDVAAVVGKAIIESFLEAYNVRLKVNLKNPDVEFYAFVKNSTLILSVNTTGESLHKRGYRVYNHPAALKTSLACCLVRYSGWRFNQTLLDPMCGGGTIPIEAVLMAKRKPLNSFRHEFAFFKLKFFNKEEYEKICEKFSEKRVEKLKVYGIDVSSKHLNGAIMNARSAGVYDDVVFILGDARKLGRYVNFKPEYIIVNPPYGIRSLRKEAVKKLYRDLLLSIKEISENTILTLITGAWNEFKAVLKELNIQDVEEKIVMHGNLLTKVFKCRIS